MSPTPELEADEGAARGRRKRKARQDVDMVALSGSDEEWGAPARKSRGRPRGPRNAAMEVEPATATYVAMAGSGKKRRKKADHDNTCIVCSRPGPVSRSIDCYSCGTIYHLRCLHPPMTERPDDPQWWCPLCTEDARPDLICATCSTEKGPFVQEVEVILCKRCFEAKADSPDQPCILEDLDDVVLVKVERSPESEAHLREYLREEVAAQQLLSPEAQQQLLRQLQDPVAGPLPLPTSSFDLHIHNSTGQNETVMENLVFIFLFDWAGGQGRTIVVVETVFAS